MECSEAVAGNRQVHILLVEDNPVDVMMAREALKARMASAHLTVCEDGLEAMAFLKHEGPYASCGFPDMIFLDLNLPKKDGREVLAHIKTDPQLRRIPVAILTTSDDENDVRRSYELQANVFMVKPTGLEEFVDLVRRTFDYWFTLAKLPSN